MDRAAAVAPGVGDVDPAGWLDRLEDLFGRVLARAFVRREPRLRAWSYLLGLVSGLERKNGWTLAEFTGDATPDGMQRLLNSAVWDEDEVRDRLTGYVAAELGDPDGVLIADKTGFLRPALPLPAATPAAVNTANASRRAGLQRSVADASGLFSDEKPCTRPSAATTVRAMQPGC